jgi:hypothetical protein
MAKKQQSLINKGVGFVDAVVGPKLTEVVQSEVVGLGVAVGVRVKRGVAARAERVSRHALHAFNLPAGSDVRRLLAQVALVEREVRELGKTIDSATAIDTVAALDAVAKGDDVSANSAGGGDG